MTVSVTIAPTGSNGQVFNISLKKTGADTAFLSIVPVGAAAGTQIELYGVQARSPSELACKGNVFGPDPVVLCRLVAGSAELPARLQVDIAGTLFAKFDGRFDYWVSPPDFAKAGAFLSEAKFPQA